MLLKNRPLRRAAILLLGALALTLGACKKQPFVEIVEQTLYLGMPAGVTHLASIDMDRLRLSEGFNDLLQQVETTTDTRTRAFLDAVHNKIGFDPFKDAGQAVMGLRGVDAENPLRNAVFIFRGNFKDGTARIDKLSAWLGEEYLADVKKIPGQHSGGAPTVKVTGKSQYDVKKTYEVNFAFPTESIMLVSLSSPLMNDALDVISGQAPGIQKDKAWMETLKRPNTGAPVWGIGNFAEFLKTAAALGPQPGEMMRSIKQYFLDLSVAPDFVMHVGLVCESIDAATKLADSMRAGFTQVKNLLGMMLMSVPAPETIKLLNGVQILNELEVARISLTVTAEDQRRLIDELPRLQSKLGSGAMMPGLPGLGPGLPPTGK